MASFVYTKFKVDCANKVHNLGSDSLKVMLLTSGYTPAQDTDHVYSDISANEVSGTGYTAGGQALSGVSVAADNSNHRMKMTATNSAWASSTITARYAVVYNSSASNDLVCCFDFGSNYTSTNGTFTVAWDATNGVLTLT